MVGVLASGLVVYFLGWGFMWFEWFAVVFVSLFVFLATAFRGFWVFCSGLFLGF